jgi:hypothetical protein
MTTTNDKPVRACPTPYKQRYALQVSAAWKANLMNTSCGWSLEPYECPCGMWHLRDWKKRNRNRGSGSQARQRLRHQQGRRRAVRPLATVLRIAEHDEWIW